MLNQFKGLIRPFLFFDIKQVREIFGQLNGDSNFVFLHYLNLHDFAYQKNCKVESKLVLGSESLPYHHHLSCMTPFVKESIDEIIKNDPNSIIIVQGDHSPMEWQSKDNFKNPETMFPILSAVYVPGLDQKGGMAKYLSNSPTPVNDFRIIFSYLSKTPVEILQGRSYNHQLKELMTLPEETVVYNPENDSLHTVLSSKGK